MVCDLGMAPLTPSRRTGSLDPGPFRRPCVVIGRFAALLLGCWASLALFADTTGPKPLQPVGSASGFPVRLECGEGTVTFTLRSRPVVTYRGGPGVVPSGVAEEYRRAGYLHPLLTPAGRVVSGDYPENHRHHHGVWTAWTRTEIDGRKPDFWNMGQKKGRVEMVEWLGARESADGAEIETRHRYVDLTAPSPATILQEAWKVRVSATPPGKPYRIDLTVRQTNVTEHPLALPEYRYGGLGFRGLDAWDGAPNCRFRTSEGVTDRVKGNESRGRWCWIGGSATTAAGAVGTAGVVLLAHPSNFRFPEPMRIHPTEPFFCWSPQQAGEFALPPRGVHAMRHRILVADGEPDPAEIEREWLEWSKEP